MPCWLPCSAAPAAPQPVAHRCGGTRGFALRATFVCSGLSPLQGFTHLQHTQPHHLQPHAWTGTCSLDWSTAAHRCPALLRHPAPVAGREPTATLPAQLPLLQPPLAASPVTWQDALVNSHDSHRCCAMIRHGMLEASGPASLLPDERHIVSVNSQLSSRQSFWTAHWTFL